MKKQFKNIDIKNIDKVIIFLEKITKFPSIICFEGEVGSGKTFLISQILKNYNFCNSPSPTFNIIHKYQNKKVSISHIDLYRFSENKIHASDLLMLKEALDADITFIEWSSLADFYKKHYYIKVSIIKNKNSRDYFISY